MRWEEQEVDAAREGRLPGFADPTVVRTFRAPDSLDVRFHEVQAKSALNRVPGAGTRLPFRWTINPYRGCLHACTFCFARPTHEFLDMDAGDDFDREIVVKVNAPEVLRAELARRSWKREHVALGTNTDPYQWVEKRYGITRAIWEVMRDFANPCSVLTKSPLLLRDADLFEELVASTHFHACLSITTLDEKAWRDTEPHTPHPRARMEAVAELNRRGIPTGILIAPVMPGINDSPEQIEAVVEAAHDAGASSIGGQALFLRGSTKRVFMAALREKRPHLVPMYEQMYGGRAYLTKADKANVEAPLVGRRKLGEARFSRPPAPGRLAKRTSAEVATGARVQPRDERPAPVAESLQGSLF